MRKRRARKDVWFEELRGRWRRLESPGYVRTLGYFDQLERDVALDGARGVVARERFRELLDVVSEIKEVVSIYEDNERRNADRWLRGQLSTLSPRLRDE
jgi:hypothetical protein